MSNTPFKLKNGSILLLTEAPGGIYNSSQLNKIAELASMDAAIVKVTEDQRLALLVKEEDAYEVTTLLGQVGLGVRNYKEGLHQPTTCLGEMCEEHVQDALGSSLQVSNELSKITLDSPLKIGINGCAQCCVPCHTLDISVVGEESGYRISLGGKGSQIPEMATFAAEGVPAQELPKLLGKVVEEFKNLSQEGETLQDVIERCGMSSFIEALSPYSQDASSDDLGGFTMESAPVEESVESESISDDSLPESEEIEDSSQEGIPDEQVSDAESVESEEILQSDAPMDSDGIPNDEVEEVPILSEEDNEQEMSSQMGNLEATAIDEDVLDSEINEPEIELKDDSIEDIPEDPQLESSMQEDASSVGIEDHEEGEIDLNPSEHLNSPESLGSDDINPQEFSEDLESIESEEEMQDEPLSEDSSEGEVEIPEMESAELLEVEDETLVDDSEEDELGPDEDYTSNEEAVATEDLEDISLNTVSEIAVSESTSNEKLWQLESLNTTPNGIEISFSNGSKIEIESSAVEMEPKKFLIDGIEILMTVEDGIFVAEFNHIKLTLPLNMEIAS